MDAPNIRPIGPRYLDEGERQLWQTTAGRWLVTINHGGDLAPSTTVYPSGPDGTITGPAWRPAFDGGHHAAIVDAGWRPGAIDPPVGDVADILERLAALVDACYAVELYPVADRLHDAHDHLKGLTQ